eukprot:CAMPEP_0116867734 /NCGR_PEP_ID=MMETSP0418-20121206/26787_1 /TAXON_ID=1158023 /ORGANISM="Astrosyne radiata, Strain 13vi08-1A" /LENGTH=121 /DNA_ID=CAMNT_0004503589 /DNA_START=214 /DNA_END=576 /DNA_ORIENTATION=-
MTATRWGPLLLWIKLIRLILATLLMSAAFVLCGASPTKNVIHTLLSAWYMVTLLLMGSSQTSDGDWLSNKNVSMPQGKLSRCRVYGTILIAIPFQLLHILDWGAQIQRWPLPILIGCTTGW